MRQAKRLGKAVNYMEGKNMSETEAATRMRQRVGVEAGEAFPSFAWPGGYPIVYVTDDADTMCADCVNDASNPVHFTGHGDGWRIDAAAIEEAPEDDVRCAHCNRVIAEGIE